jgi:transcriptional regulator with XRE-family HTH domain
MHVNQKVNIDVRVLSEAIRNLRQALGETQDNMARRLGYPLGSYVRWEKGRAEPGGRALIKILNLCPDLETLRAFGVNIPPDQPTSAAAGRKMIPQLGGG